MRRFAWALLFALALTSAPALPPAQTSPPPTTQSQGNPNVKVWVNTKTGVYHCPGKQGQFMSQKEAQAHGYRAAYGKVCQ
ncbi:MAG TPA: hypothetical protein VEG08_11575 [Terriglobales bacterium]|nr:hypothetical protein [Terriglobales bacterium]